MSDPFFSQKSCNRCGRDLSGGMTMSWFTEEAICMTCSEKEQTIKKALRERGIADAMEGCGYVPEIETTTTK